MIIQIWGAPAETIGEKLTYKLSQEEKQTGTIATTKLKAILDDIRTIGFAVVEGVVSESTCRLMSESVLEDVEKIRAKGEKTPHEKLTGEGHLQLGLRRHAPYVKVDLVANPIIECVVSGLLEEGAWLGFYNGNVNCPGSTAQPLHFDRPSSWRTEADAERDGQSWPPPATTLSCSIALEEITEENGATEIYPGSHTEISVMSWGMEERLRNHPDLIEKWAPPGRMPIPAGGVCFRDPRMWHRGVPNRAGKPRAMIAATYHAARCQHWRGTYTQDLDVERAEKLAVNPELRIMDDGKLGDGRLVFQDDAQDVFEAADNIHGINRNVRFVKSPDRVNHFLDAHLLGGARVVRNADISP